MAEGDGLREAGHGQAEAAHQPREGEERHRARVELVATVVLAIATVLTAWSAFQSAKWSGVQAIEFSQASSLRTESVRASTEADTLIAIDVDLFVAWASAVSDEAGEEAIEDYSPEPGTLSGFLFERFRDEFKPAVRAWLDTRPLVNDDAPATPFGMPEYQLAKSQESALLAEQADASREDALESNQRSDNYVLTTVLFAAVLFFAGVSTKLTARRPRLLMLGCAVVLLLAGGVIVATFPVEI